MRRRLQQGVARRIDRRRSTAARGRAVERLRRAHPTPVGDYEKLCDAAVSLLPVGDAAPTPVVRLLLPLSRPDALFAGMRTAIAAAGRLAQQLDRALEIRHYDWSNRDPRSDARSFAAIADLPADRIRVQYAWHLGKQHQEDLTVATFWDTAYAAMVAARAGLLDRTRVLYLVQDYEPEFYAASTDSALSRSTYHAGLRMITNSTPLASFLRDREGVEVSERDVFRPHVDVDQIAGVAQRRASSEHLRITFYGRPGSARNSFELGVASIRVADRAFKERNLAATFVSVGQQHPALALSEGEMRSLGKLSWSGYFDQLAKTDVMLSFQQTPHPSHPPLDAVASGAFAVTNDIAHSRTGLSCRLLAVDSDPVAVAAALQVAADRVLAGDLRPTLDESFLERYGRPLHDVIDDAASSYA